MKSNILRLAELLEGAGFHVDRIAHENYRDAGYASGDANLDGKTGAIIITVTPEEKKGEPA